MSVEFEYEPVKSAANKVKYGLDFDEANVELRRVDVDFPAWSLKAWTVRPADWVSAVRL